MNREKCSLISTWCGPALKTSRVGVCVLKIGQTKMLTRESAIVKMNCETVENRNLQQIKYLSNEGYLMASSSNNPIK